MSGLRLGLIEHPPCRWADDPIYVFREAPMSPVTFSMSTSCRSIFPNELQPAINGSNLSYSHHRL